MREDPRIRPRNPPDEAPDATDFNKRLRQALEDGDTCKARRLLARNLHHNIESETRMVLVKRLYELDPPPRPKHRPKGTKLHGRLIDRLRLGKEFHDRMAEIPRGERSYREAEVAEGIGLSVKQLQLYRKEFNNAVAVVGPDYEDIDSLFGMYCIIKNIGPFDAYSDMADLLEMYGFGDFRN